ncbi:MAG: hypothetical protein LWX11_04905 [Firmicutes bacterium]|nr:hypothetical protein [Bacillota bacterium]
MFRRFRSAWIVPLCLAGLACGAPQVVLDRSRSWVESDKAAVKIDISGSWESVQSYFAGGWGPGQFQQTDGKVIGSLGPYNVEGRVVGNKVRMMIYSGRQVYTAELALKGDTLSGIAYLNTLPDDPNAYKAPVELRRVKNP